MALAELFSERRGNELVGIVIFAATTLVLVSLVTYHPADPAWFFSEGGERFAAQNAIGRFGAFLSIVLYESFGLTAFALPVLSGILGWFFFWGRNVSPLWLRALNFAVLMGVLAGLGDLVLEKIVLFGRPIAAGGLVGAGIANLLVPYLNVFGAMVVLVAVALAAFSMATCLSYGQAASRAAALAKSLAHRARVLFFYRQEVRRKTKKRTEVLKRHAQRAAETKHEKRDPAEALRGEAEGTLFESTPEAGLRKGTYLFPPVRLLDLPEHGDTLRHEDLVERGRALTAKFLEFGIEGEVTEIHPGPVVTMFEFRPAGGIKYSRLISLADDLCLALRAESILIDRIPGKPTVGIEVPNEHRETIFLRELLEDATFQKSSASMPLALGKQIQGEAHVSDLAEMPHLLVAGTTGAGKSVAIHAMLLSLLACRTPDELKLILIDPKRVELGLYDGVPHLYAPVVADAKQAAQVLKWLVKEMENRYKMLASYGVKTRNIDQFNRYLKNYGGHLRDEDGEPLKPLPYIAVVIDEFADLMMVAPREVEDAVGRIAQMARAVGIHLIIATQRPSVDIITGVIKANFPSRLSFRVSSKVDSRTILDGNGAERLLGKGDMLFLPPGTSRLRRLHGGLVTAKEIQRVVHHLKLQGVPEYNEVLAHPSQLTNEGEGAAFTEMEDEIYDDAVKLVVSSRTASVSNLQRRFGIGYNRAARLIDMMEADGVVGPARGAKPRKLLVSSVDSLPQRAAQ